MPGDYFKASAVGRAVPFDNSTNGFTSTDVQSAIEEVRSVFTSPSTDQQYWVSKQGNDTTGNGSIGTPYLTIGKALTVITDSSPTKRYSINVGPGDYNENLVLKANVFIRGSGPIATKLTGTTLNINDTTWNVTSADNRSGFQDMSVNPACTFNFSSQTNNTDGKIYAWNIRTSGAWTITANTNVNQVIVHDSQIFGSITCVASNTVLFSCLVQAALSISSGTTAGQGAGILSMYGGGTSSTISATWTSNGIITLNLYEFGITSATTLTASGASCTVNSTAGSLPIPANRTFSSSAVLNRLSDGFAGGLLSATTNITVSSATAPSAGQVLVASSSTAAAWGNPSTLITTNTTATGTVTTTSGTDALITTMTITPASGTYRVTYNSDVQCNNAGGAVSFSFYVGGSQQAGTLLKTIPLDGGTLSIGTGRDIVFMQADCVVNGSQAIEVRWSTSGGTATVGNRVLQTLRIA